MALSDFSTLLSRQFLIGFMAPALGSLFLLCQFLPSDWLPHSYRTATSATQVIIIGATAVFIGLVLSGLRFPVLRLLEGYPLQRLDGRKLGGRYYAWRQKHWEDEYDRLIAALAGPKGPARSKAALRLNDAFPAKRESILPTEFGNVLRAFETHPRKRYCLDGITIWPRIQLLLNENERAELDDASTDMMFFVNGLVAIVVTGLVFVAAAAAHAPTFGAAAWRCALLSAGTAVGAWLAWRASIGAGRRWGAPVRAAFDLHRLELFDRLGVKVPTSTDGDERIGKAVSRLLLYAEPVPDECRKQPVDLDPKGTTS
jgi:hypothetical protein